MVYFDKIASQTDRLSDEDETMSSNNNQNFDWQRIEKALAVEIEYGYQNLKGKQYRFSEFLCLTFGNKPPVTNVGVAFHWQNTAKQFARYPQLNTNQREELISKTQELIIQIKNFAQNQPLIAKEAKPDNSLSVKTPSTNSVAKTTTKTVSNLSLNDRVTYLQSIALRKQDLLLKLGIKTIQDLLFYYPRDHIDYARQVNIKDLNPGETVTIIGKVQKVSCFSSPRNKKLTIFSLTVQDGTGEVKLSRFYAVVITVTVVGKKKSNECILVMP